MNLGNAIDIFISICLCGCIFQITRLSSSIKKLQNQIEDEIDSLKKELKDTSNVRVETDLNKRLDDFQRMKFSPLNLRVITNRKEHE